MLKNNLYYKPIFLLPKEELKWIIKISKDNLPCEACALIGYKMINKRKFHIKLYQTKNHSNGLSYFNITKEDINSCERKASRNNEIIFGCFHSHPRGPAKPSPTDILNAKNTTYKYWLIYSVAHQDLKLYHMLNFPTKINYLITN